MVTLVSGNKTNLIRLLETISNALSTMKTRGVFSIKTNTAIKSEIINFNIER